MTQPSQPAQAFQESGKDQTTFAMSSFLRGDMPDCEGMLAREGILPCEQRLLNDGYLSSAQFAIADLFTTCYGDSAANRLAALLLDADTTLAFCTISVGVADAGAVQARELFRAAILVGATQIILIRSDIAASPEPSSEEWTAMKSLIETLDSAGKPLGIAVQDYMVVNGRSYFSLWEKLQEEEHESLK